MMINKVSAWKTSDNTLFCDPALARQHQAKVDLIKLFLEHYENHREVDAFITIILNDRKFAEELHSILHGLLHPAPEVKGD